MLDWLKKRLLTIPSEACSFERRGFAACDVELRAHLEQIIDALLEGYHLALELDDHDRLVAQLEQNLDKHRVGFAFEGVGLYLALRDLLPGGRSDHLTSFVNQAGHRYDYVAAIGAGFALARLPWGRCMLRRYRRKLEPTLAWCVADGYGFHQGIFHHAMFVDRCARPPRCIPEYDCAPFDSGLGRSLWWVKGAAPAEIQKTILRFPESRQPELWSGIGVACSFAGGVSQDDLWQLYERAEKCRDDFLSGIPFTACVRQKGQNPSPWTDRACALLLNMTTGEAADLLMAVIDEGDADPSYSEQYKLKHGYATVRARLAQRIQAATRETPLETRSPD